MRSSFVIAIAGASLVSLLVGGCSKQDQPGNQDSLNAAAAQSTPSADTDVLDDPDDTEVSDEAPDDTTIHASEAVEVGPLYEWYSPVSVGEYSLLTYELIEQYAMPCTGPPYNLSPNLGDETWALNYFTDAGARAYAQKDYPDCAYIPVDTVAPGDHIVFRVASFASNDEALAALRTTLGGERVDAHGVLCSDGAAGDLAICNLVVGQWGVDAVMALDPAATDADAQVDYLGELMLAFAKSNAVFGAEVP